MPCWYFEKKEIKNSPSYRDGIDSAVEARYRREGARFINDAGTKLGLRYDTCATGVVYFHRFYMFHSFKDFPRYVTASCCLFLAGKVEETPKKCKDIIKISQQILNPKQFTQFGNDPKEEVMTLERILLQTIKFDLQTEHPYAFLLKFAKMIKGDKEKIQKLVQMAWTFINDSLCTTLSLQWEPEIIAVSLMYLGTRLNKFEIVDWIGKVPGAKQKWWEFIVDDLTVELMEDICHQVLDLYSPSNQVQAEPGESPPPPPPVQNASRTPTSQGSDRKLSLPSTPSDPITPGGQSNKSLKTEGGNQLRKLTPQKSTEKGRSSGQQQSTDSSQTKAPSGSTSAGSSQNPFGANPSKPQTPVSFSSSSQYPSSGTDFSNYNPYLSANQYQSSFMSQEGAQSLQSIMGTQTATYVQSSLNQPQYSSYTQPQLSAGAQPAAQFGIAGSQQYPPGYNPAQYPAGAAAPGPPITAVQPSFNQQQQQPQQFHGQPYSQFTQYTNYQQPSANSQTGYDQQNVQAPQYQSGGAYSGNAPAQRPRSSQTTQRPPQPRSSSALTTVRITGR